MAAEVKKGDEVIALNDGGKRFKVENVSKGHAELSRVLPKPAKAEAESNLVVPVEHFNDPEKWIPGP